MLRVGITSSDTNFQNYPNWISGDGIEVILLSYQENNLQDFRRCDGFLLTGGIDLHPQFYQNSRVDYPNTTVFSEARDLFEIQVFDYACQQNKPVLAICRGLQLVNVALGGTLFQDLQESGFLNHRKTSEGDFEHNILVKPDSLLAKISGTHGGFVNSAHHQGIDQIAIGLKVSAYSEDGVVEAIEYKEASKPFLLAVQWHPERMQIPATNEAFSQNIRSAFIEAMLNQTSMNLINPATEEIITTVQADSLESLTLKLNRLQKSASAWAAVPIQKRAEILEKFVSLLKENVEELAAILTSEMGKPLQQSRNEINGAGAKAIWLVQHASQYLSEEIMSASDTMTEKIIYEPLGVICNISAWNYPYNVGVNIFVPALLAGNAVMYKPSEYAILTGLQIGKYLVEAGVPEEVFQVAIGAGEVGRALLDMPFNGYYFTGSYQTGQKIYEHVSKKMVPCILELGGKDPIYVADDVVDVAGAAAGIADGAFYNNGQSCCSVERIYVQSAIYNEFVQAFVKEVQSWKMGSPTEEGVYITVLSRKAQLEVLENQVADALAKGAQVLMGGKRVDQKGNYFEPTVLVNVSHDMAVMRDESFGPIIGIMKVENDAEAVLLMNDTAYGLTAGVYSADQNRAEAILAQIDAGSGYWNCCDRVSASLPWSGRRNSGFGSTLSQVGLRAFTKPKAYHLRK